MKENLEQSKIKRIINKNEDSPLVKVPEQKKELFSKVKKIQNDLFVKNGYYPGLSEVIAVLKEEGFYNDSDVFDVKDNILDNDITREIDNYLLSDDISEVESYNEETDLYNSVSNEAIQNLDIESLKKDINTILETLSPQRAYVLKKFFNLDHDDFVSDKETKVKKIAVEMNLEEKRVWEILQAAIRMLRHTKRSSVLKKYIG